MRMDLDYSREANDSGIRIEGLQNGNDGFGSGFDFMASATTWYLGVPELLSDFGSGILWGIGGIQLFAQYFQQTCTVNYTGVDNWAPYVSFRFDPIMMWTTMSDVAYCEASNFIALELSIPLAGHNGWYILPLNYYIRAQPGWHGGGDILNPIWVNDTVNLVVFTNPSGQCDAGIYGDAGPNTVETQRNITAPLDFHGYLGSTDPEDLYAFNVSAGALNPPVTIDFSMTPPPYVDFNLTLYDPYNHVVSTCDNGPGSTATVLNCTSIMGAWKVAICSVTGTGVYACSLSLRTSDINQDGKVDIYDAIILAGHFNTNTNSPNWLPAADLNGDSTVDIYDAIILAGHFDQGTTPHGAMLGMKTDTGGGASVSVSPSSVTVFKGEVFSVNVSIASVTDLAGWEFKLYWNNTVLNCTNAAVVSPAQWQNYTQDYGSGLQNSYNATNGLFFKAEAAACPAPTFNGSMTIATLTFGAMQPGSTSLALTETKLGNSTAQPIDHTDSSGSVTVYYGRYMRGDTMTVNGLNAYKLNYTESSSLQSFTKTASGVGAECGIRVWVRHSNGVESEVTLDGQTGTPEAVDSSCGTTSVSQTSLQSTDSLVVRVYVSVGGGAWTLAATFTTEQLNATTLKAATWTVYYTLTTVWHRQTQSTTATFYWGDASHNSRIQNLQYS